LPWAFDNLGGGRIRDHGNAAGLAGTGRSVLRIRERESEAPDYQAGAYRGTSAADQVFPPGDPSHVSRFQAGTSLLTYQASSSSLEDLSNRQTRNCGKKVKAFLHRGIHRNFYRAIVVICK